MQKERIEVVLVPQEQKKENEFFVYLFGKWKMMLAFLLVGSLLGATGVFLYYKSTQRLKGQVDAEAPIIQTATPLDTEFLTAKLKDTGYTVLNFPALARAQMAGYEEQAKQLLLKHNELFGAVGRPELTYEIGLSRQSLSSTEVILLSMDEHAQGTPGLLQNAGKAYLEEKIAVNKAVIESVEAYLQVEVGAGAYIEAQKVLQPLIRETEQYKSILDGTFIDSDPEGTNAMLAQMEIYAKLIDDAKEELSRLYVKYIETPSQAAAVAAANAGPHFSKVKAAAIVCLCMAGACILWLIVALLQKEWSRILLESKEK